MEKKQIEVDCPCCKSRLAIDVLTRAVTRATPPGELDETGKPFLDEGRWDSAAGRVADRALGAEDKLESMLEAEREKGARFEDLFDKARKKVQEREDDADSPG